MQPTVQRDCARRLLAHLEAGTTDLADEPLRLPATHFTDPDHLARERDRLFRRSPTVAALSSDLPEAGDFVPVDVGGVPLLLIRQRDGAVQAFINACRHRGSPLATDRGSTQGGALRCPFHSWTYSTSGQLLATPQAEVGFAGCDKSTLGLLPRPCLEVDGLILVRAVGDAPIDAERALVGIRDDLQALDLRGYHHFETRTTEWSCNWKLALATFLESYHVFSLHRETVDPWYLSHPMIHDGWGPNLRFPVARRAIRDLAHRPEASWRLGDYATLQWLVGSTRLITHTRDTALLWQFEALMPDRCQIRTSFYSTARALAPMWATSPALADDAGREPLVSAFGLQLRVTGEEDFPAQERIQGVLRSGQLPEVWFGRNEAAAIHFHRSLAEQLAPEARGDQ